MVDVDQQWADQANEQQGQEQDCAGRQIEVAA